MCHVNPGQGLQTLRLSEDILSETPSKKGAAEESSKECGWEGKDTKGLNPYLPQREISK